jgi:hypothetical protein
MEPISQTVLTIICMLATWFWGNKQGAVGGSQHTWSIVIDAFDATHIEWQEENNELVFTNEYGKTFKASEVFKNVSKADNKENDCDI